MADRSFSKNDFEKCHNRHHYRLFQKQEEHCFTCPLEGTEGVEPSTTWLTAMRSTD